MGSADIVIATPDPEALRAEYSPIVARAAALQVRTPQEYEDAQLCLRDLRRAKKSVILDRLNPIIDHLYKGHRGMTSLRAELLRPIDGAEAIIDGKCAGFERDQRRIAEQAQRAAQEAARKLEEERRLVEAIEAESEGDAEEAEAILDAPPPPAPVIRIEPDLPKVEGVSRRESWKADVDRPNPSAEALRFIAAHPELALTVVWHMPTLNALARSQREALAIPGVRAVAETIRAVRS